MVVKSLKIYIYSIYIWAPAGYCGMHRALAHFDRLTFQTKPSRGALSLLPALASSPSLFSCFVHFGHEYFTSMHECRNQDHGGALYILRHTLCALNAECHCACIGDCIGGGHFRRYSLYLHVSLIVSLRSGTLRKGF